MAYFVRSLLWYCKGSWSFTASGYEKASKNFKDIKSIDVDGRSFMVTGGSTGIGKSVATFLVEKKGTFVHIVCKDSDRGNQALEFLKSKAHPSSSVFLHLVDMSEPLKVKEFAKNFVNVGHKLNVLINNAGVLANSLEMTSSNHEKSFSLNVLGTYLLTKLMLPVLEASVVNSSKPRVITVSSGGMLTADLDYNHPSAIKQPFSGVSAYAQHKRQQVVITDIFSDKYPNIQFSSMHPGWADTPGVQTSLPSFYNSMKNNLRTPEQGADTIVWLAISDEALGYRSGSFFFDREKSNKFAISKDDRYKKEIEEKYLENLEKIVSEIPDLN